MEIVPGVLEPRLVSVGVHTSYELFKSRIGLRIQASGVTGMGVGGSAHTGDDPLLKASPNPVFAGVIDGHDGKKCGCGRISKSRRKSSGYMEARALCDVIAIG